MLSTPIITPAGVDSAVRITSNESKGQPSTDLLSVTQTKSLGYWTLKWNYSYRPHSLFSMSTFDNSENYGSTRFSRKMAWRWFGVESPSILKTDGWPGSVRSQDISYSYISLLKMIFMILTAKKRPGQTWLPNPNLAYLLLASEALGHMFLSNNLREIGWSNVGCGPCVHLIIRPRLCFCKLCETKAIKLIRIVAVVRIKLARSSWKCKACSSGQRKTITEFKGLVDDSTSAVHYTRVSNWPPTSSTAQNLRVKIG